MKALIVKCQDCGAKNKVPAFKQHLRPKCGKCGSPISMEPHIQPYDLNDRDFMDFIEQAPLPVLVDFYSPACGPCQMMAPVIDRLAVRFHKKMLVTKINTSSNQQTALRYQIRGVPTIIFFKQGSPIKQLVGAIPEEQLASTIQTIL